MPKLTVDQGLEASLDNDYGNAGVDVIDAMCISNFGTLLASTTSVEAAGSKDCNAFTSSTRAGKVQTVVGDWGTGEGNFTITTITLHRGGAGVFTHLYGGIDGQSIAKTVDFTLKITITDTRASG